jgi:arsenate reductase (thioredoxin)
MEVGYKLKTNKPVPNMKKYFLLSIMAGSTFFNGLAQDTTGINNQKTVIFICDHGAYKSVVAAAAFNKLAKEQGLNIKAVARGLVPGKEIAINALNGLKQDSFSEITPVPQKLSNEELAKATRVVTFCTLPAAYSQPLSFEDWKQIPLVNANYPDFRDSVLPHVKLLINSLKKQP